MSTLTLIFDPVFVSYLRRVDMSVGSSQETSRLFTSYVASAVQSGGQRPSKGGKAKHCVAIMDTIQRNDKGKEVRRSGVREVFLKWAQGPLQYARLEREAGLYANELRGLQGEVVPRCYGFYAGQQGGTDFGCLVLEYCSGSLPGDVLEFNRQVMVQACRLHAAHIIHGDLQDHNHILAHEDGLRIVDFSKAARHNCEGSFPIVSSEWQNSCPVGCRELWWLEKTFGRKSGLV